MAAAIVAFEAGYITTEPGQNAMLIGKQAKYVFVISSITAFFFSVMSKRYQKLQWYIGVCMMFAYSSIAHIILHCFGASAWTLYLPYASVFFTLLQLASLLGIASSSYDDDIAIRQRFSATLHEAMFPYVHEQRKKKISDISIMTLMIAFGAGCITNPTAQNPLFLFAKKDIYVFVFFSLTALLFLAMSKRYEKLQEYTGVCMMLASSSIARIIVQCPGGYAWTVYVPSAIVFFVFVIQDLVHMFLFNGVSATHRLGWIFGIPSPASSSAMAIRQRLSAILHEDIQVQESPV